MDQKSRGQPQFMPPGHFAEILKYAERMQRGISSAQPASPIHVPKATGNIIIPIEKNMTWIDGFNETRNQGGMPSNVLHDDYLVCTEKYKELPSSYYAAWAREVVAYPQANRVFKRGEDLVDENWILPWEYISKLNDAVEFVGEKGRALFIEPLDVHIDGNRVIIIPDLQSTIVLSNFLQQGGCGKVDEATRMPMKVTDQELNNLSENETRHLYRISGNGLRPLSRYDDGRCVVNAARGTDHRGVARVEWWHG